MQVIDYKLINVRYKKGKPRRPVDERFLNVLQTVMETGYFQSDSDLARVAGWPANLRWRIREGAQKVSEASIDKLIAVYKAKKISKLYIMLGTGPMFESQSFDQMHLDNKGNFSIAVAASDSGPAHMVVNNGSEMTSKHELSDVEMVSGEQRKIRVPVIPLDAKASFVESIDGAWQLSHLDGLYTEWVEKVQGVRYNYLTVVFKITGDSMSPDYKPGGKVLSTFVDPSAWQYMRGTHVLSLKSGMLLLKKVIPSGNGTFTLQSSNQHYRDETILDEEILAAWKVQYKTYEPAE